MRRNFSKKFLAFFTLFSLLFSLLPPAHVVLAQDLSVENQSDSARIALNPDLGQDFSLSSKDLDLSIASVSGAQFATNFVAADNAGLSPRNSGNFGVDELTGTFSFNYPIALPPGRASIEPGLALQYNHQRRNVGSMAGFGWALNLPYIQRDNRFGVDELYNRNDFVLSLGGISMLEPVSVDANGYGTYGKKIETDFAKIEFTSANKWLVTDKLGAVYTFGASAASRQDNPANASQIYKWMLEEVRDTNDNFVRYEYYKDSGQIYPKKVFYTGTGTIDGIFTVEFQPFANGAPVENNVLTTSYQSGFQVKTKYLLDSIDVKINGALKTSYKLGFSSGDSKYLLTSIAPEFYDGGPAEVKDKVDFEYSFEPTSYTLADPGYYQLPNVLGENPGLSIQSDVFIDLNGDSLTDYLRTTCDTNGDLNVDAWTNNGAGGWVSSIDYSKFIDAAYNCSTNFGQSHTMPIAFANLDGDNLVDMVTDSTFFINTGSGWQASAANLPVSLHDSTSNGEPPANQVIFRDMNGDGYDDLIYNQHPTSIDASVDVYIRDESTGSWNLDSDYSLSVNMGAWECLAYGGDPFGFVDLNSDGLPDIFYGYNCYFGTYSSSDSGVYINTGQGFILSTDYQIPTNVSNYSGTGTAHQDIHYFSDFNQDGVYDSGGYHRQTWTTVSGDWSSGSLSLFGEVFNTGAIGGSEYFDNTLPVAIADINGDQIQDVVHSYSSTFDLYLGRSVKPDVLEKISYQSGAQTYIYYDYSAQEKDELGNSANPDLPFSLYVVKEVVNDNGDGQWLGTRYFYKDGKTVSYLSEGIKDVFGFGEVEKHSGKAMPDIDFGTGVDGAFVSSGNATWSADKNFTSLTIQSGHIITVEPQVIIKVQGDAVINGTLSTKGQGYQGGPGGTNHTIDRGPGGGADGENSVFSTGSSEGGAGAGHAERGQDAPAIVGGDAPSGGAIYGNELLENIDKGSGGGKSGNVGANPGRTGGTGGGIIQLFAHNLSVNGSIDADGNDGEDGYTATNVYVAGSGAGSGGSIYIKTLETADLGTNLVHAQGGIGGVASDGVNKGGDGSPGRIRVEAPQIIGTTNPAYYSVGDFDYSILNTSQDPDLKKTVEFYHLAADNGLHLHGRLSQTETSDAQDVPVSTSFQNWQETDLGNGRKFVSLADSSNTDFSGTPVSTATRYTYDASNGNILTEQQLGQVTVNTLTGVIADDLIGDEKTITYQYASNAGEHILALPKTQIVSDGVDSRQKDFYYDGLLLGQVDKGNLTTEDFMVDDVALNRAYNSFGLMTSETDAKGNTTTITYDANSLYPSQTTNALTQITVTTFNLLNGELETSTDPNGFITENSFDVFGRIVETKTSDIDNPTQVVTSQTISYDDTNLPRHREITTYLDSTNSVVFREYKNGQDQLVQTKTEMENGNYSTVDFTYDPFGRLTRQSLPYSTASIGYSDPDLSKPAKNYSYDVLDRVLIETTTVGSTSYAYDGLTTTITDANGNDKDLTNDAYGNLVTVKEHNGVETYTTVYEYNPFNDLTKITDALSNVRNFTYDGLGRRTAAEDLHAASDVTFGAWSYAYDKNGNLMQSIDPNNQTINYTYDELNRVATEDFAGQTGTEVSYVYDTCTNGVGYLCSASSTASLITYTYKINGLVASEAATIDAQQFDTAYDYDRQGNMTLTTYPDNSEVKYVYNTAGQLETVEQKEDGAVTFSPLVTNFNYDAAGNMIRQENANGTLTQNTYDPNQLYRLVNRLTEINGQMGMALLAFSDTETSLDPPLPALSEVEGSMGEQVQSDWLQGVTNLPALLISENPPLADEGGDVTSSTEVDSGLVASSTDEVILVPPLSRGGDPAAREQLGEEGLDSTSSDETTVDDPSTEFIPYGDMGLGEEVLLPESDSSNEPMVEDQNTSGGQTTPTLALPLIEGEDEGGGAPVVNEYSSFSSQETIGADTPTTPTTEEVIGTGSGLETVSGETTESIIDNPPLPALSEAEGSEGEQDQSDWLQRVTNLPAPLLRENPGLRRGGGGENVSDGLKGKTAKEKANIKAAEIAKLDLGTHFTYISSLPISEGEGEGGGLRIEIQSLKKIEGGIEVLARAWKNGEPVGFGRDGTVEIERFRIFNPPILVPDGTFKSVHDPWLGIEVSISNFKEDLTEALKQSLAHTIKVVAKGSKNIVPGKVGHTTSIIYVGSGDGRTGGGEATWDPIHDATTKGVDGVLQVATGLFDGNYQINRAYAPFDTSVIGAGQEVSSATFSAFNAASGDGDNDGLDYITIVQVTPATDNVLTGDDYDQYGAINNPVEGIDSANRVDLSSVTAEQYQDFALNATGMSWINPVGWTNLGAREGHDTEDSIYAGAAQTFNYLRWYDSDETGTTKDPKLVVEHFVAGGGSAPSEPTGLRTEGLVNPIDVSDTTPEFSALYNDLDAGDNAVNYQLQVSTTTAAWTTPIWDSAKTTMATTTVATRSPELEYGGTPLPRDGSSYYWRIKFWDQNDNEGAWSTETASFAMDVASSTSNTSQDLIYAYDAVGNITQIVDNSANNGAKTTTYTYDNLNRLTSAVTTDAVSIGNYTRTYTYDAIGNITNKSDLGAYQYLGSQATNYANPHAVTDINGIAYAYDNNGNLTSDSSWNHVWDYKNRLIQSTSDAELVDSESFETSLGNWVNSSTDTCDWLRDSGGTPSVNTGPSAGFDGSYYAYVETSSGSCYTSGNTSDLEYILSQATAGKVEFNYHMYGSNIGTLAVEAYDGSTWTNIWSLSGNQGDSWSTLQSASFDAGTTKLRFHYTAAGGWQGDAAIDLVAVYEGISNTSTYAYNHSGQRVKLDNGTKVKSYPNKYYNSDSTDVTKHIFSPDGLMLATVEGFGTASSTINYIHTDHLGGTHVVSDETGTQVELNDYYPFGDLRISEGTAKEQRKYTGHEYDEDTNLTYANARYYNQGIGRFISADPWFGNLSNPQSFNKYAYGANNPIRYTDPSGMTQREAVGGWARGVGESAWGTVTYLSGWFWNPAQSSQELAESVQYVGGQAFDLGSDLFGNPGQTMSEIKQGLEISYQEFMSQSDYEIGRNIGNWTGDAMQAVIAKKVTEKLFAPSPSASAPNRAYDVFNQVKENNFKSAPQGYKGGSIFENKEGLLPSRSAGYYQEWDINPSVQGVPRGTERLVTGQGGEAWYTPDHYKTFVDIE